MPLDIQKKIIIQKWLKPIVVPKEDLYRHPKDAEPRFFVAEPTSRKVKALKHKLWMHDYIKHTEKITAQGGKLLSKLFFDLNGELDISKLRFDHAKDSFALIYNLFTSDKYNAHIREKREIVNFLIQYDKF